MVVAEKPIDPELVEYPGLAPLLEAPVRRGMVADARPIERLPLAARARHKENGVHGRAIIYPRVVAAQRVRLSRRQKLLHLLPERIGKAPAIVFDNKAHTKKSSFLRQTFPTISRLQALLR